MTGKRKNLPPRLAVGLLRRFLPQKDSLFLLGDFEEIFRDRLTGNGRLSAMCWYWGQACITNKQSGITKARIRIPLIVFTPNSNYNDFQ